MPDERNEVSTSQESALERGTRLHLHFADLSREEQYKISLESMIDTQGLSNLLDLIGEVCRAKEEQCAELDHPAARNWWAAAVHIEHASNKITMSGL